MNLLKSEVWSKVLTMMLWVLVALSVVELVFSAFYVLNYDFFYDRIYPVYGFVETMYVVLYYVVCIVFLIWIYRVHMDLNRMFLQFPRTPGKALACLMIPVYNLYGIPSTFRRIGDSYRSGITGFRSQGQWIYHLALPLLILIYVSNTLNRAIARVDVISDSLMLSTSIVEVVLYTIFLTLTILIAKGLTLARAEVAHHTAEAEPIIEAQQPSVSL
jgi:hypothetical protein